MGRQLVTTPETPEHTAPLGRALEGLRVLNFPGRAADFCGYLLHHLGAHVVKVTIDDADRPATSSAATPNYYAEAYDTGKEIVRIADDSEREALESLVDEADIVITDSTESCTPPLSYQQLSALHPAVIHADITTFGRSGPKGNLPGGDLVATAQSGYLHLTGTPGEMPVRMGADQASKLGGAEAAAAIMVALRYRDRTGKGQHVDVALRDAMIRASVNAIPKFRYEGVVQDRVGDHWGVREKPLKALWKCRDGWVSFVRRGGVLGGRVNHACIEWLNEFGIDTGSLGSIDWDTIDLGNPEHRKQIDELDDLFEKFLETREVEAVFREGLDRGMTLAPVRTLTEVLAEPQLSIRDYWRTVQGNGREVRVPRFIVKSSAPAPAPTSYDTAPAGVIRDDR